MQTVIVPGTFKELAEWHYEYMATGTDKIINIILFGGDRLTTIQDGGAFFAKQDQNIVGVVTWSPTGEDRNGPGIIGLWVRRDCRRRITGQDIAGDLMKNAIKSLTPCLNGKKIKVDVVSKDARSVCSRDRLGDDVEHLDCHFHNWMEEIRG